MNNNDLIVKRAKQRLRKIRNFYKHCVLFVVGIIIAAVAQNAFFSGVKLTLAVFIIWSFFIVGHAIYAYDFEIFGSNWEKKELEKLIEKEKRRN